ncbi:Hsp20/alpha crystallin family protein [Aidingimonas halophila]|uniref:HSP20 family protein n=1 Tax=Aidingimonas halophila TaxID=574349 RepID=A0A1H3FVA5_9GAMM|nr:Hsp20/alpha crystallin family protein [Aidingimonas halophila]GHC38473.1 molecular chaperone Hsp20 [Aidingimonas halophila]SDX94278.1 HSP20 family protein [Aidingimonas halophila]
MFGDLKRFDTHQYQPDWFQQLFDSLFPDTGAADIRSVPRGSFPLINVGRTDDAVHVYVFGAGLTAGDLEISIQDNVLTLQGKRGTQDEDDAGEKARSHYRRERASGEFSRTIALPEGLDPDRAEAQFSNGVFRIHLPKRAELKPRRVEIQAA